MRPTVCLLVAIHEEGHHGTRGQEICQIVPRDQTGETTQLPPLRQRIFV
jgi:hypothetical protein